MWGYLRRRAPSALAGGDRICKSLFAGVFSVSSATLCGDASVPMSFQQVPSLCARICQVLSALCVHASTPTDPWCAQMETSMCQCMALLRRVRMQPRAAWA